MISNGGFVYRRFGITERVGDSRIERVGSLIIGVAQGQFPEFEQNHTFEEWQRIIHRMLTEDERLTLGRLLGRPIGMETHFTLWMSLDYRPIIETQPRFESALGRRFWVETWDD